MTLFAEIAVHAHFARETYHYRVPPELEGKADAGHLVRVPFGKQIAQGVILRLSEESPIADTRDILNLLDPQPVLTSAHIALVEWMAESTLSPIGAVISLMLPIGIGQRATTRYELRRSLPSALDEFSATQKRILTLLRRRGALTSRQIDRHFRNVDWRNSAQALVRRGILSAESFLPPPRVRPKYVRTAELAVPPEEAEAALPSLGTTPATQARRAAALRLLMREPDAIQVSWIYAESGCSLSDLQILAERGLILLRETEIWRDPLARLSFSENLPPKTPLSLTPAQRRAFDAILAAMNGDSPQPILLHGVTGSGKTEVYLHAAAEAARRGKQSLILVPEIALTPQMVRRFFARFPGEVGLVHSKLSEGERYDTWRRARAGRLKVVIGARSALFTPLPALGLIVLDEFHDSSYHQTEPPFYDAVRAAEALAHFAGAACVFGSATPPVAYRYHAERGAFRLVTLKERISAESPDSARRLTLPPVQVVDMREELKAGNRHIFSRALQESIAEVLSRGEQAILYLNRRGSATYVFCRECGYTLKCPKCDSPLTLHTTGGERLLCHRCGYTRHVPKICPQCGSSHIRAYGLGSEQVEREVSRLFPQARTLRWDWETTRRKNAHEIILSHFASHRADVLIGTQMLAKGLDLPLVTLVGMVLADVGLALPDPFAEERVFQLLMQVAGRAGRSKRGGRVILQTFQPEHPAIRFASLHDYEGFYAREMAYRQELGYPPFTRLARLEFRSPRSSEAESAALRLADVLRAHIAKERRVETSLIGPAPCFFSRVGGEYRWQVVVRAPKPEEFLRAHLDALEGWRVELDPISLL